MAISQAARKMLGTRIRRRVVADEQIRERQIALIENALAMARREIRRSSTIDILGSDRIGQLLAATRALSEVNRG
jgi:hypothetical protein